MKERVNQCCAVLRAAATNPTVEPEIAHARCRHGCRQHIAHAVTRGRCH